jgi:hypothetical protein
VTAHGADHLCYLTTKLSSNFTKSCHARWLDQQYFIDFKSMFRLSRAAIIGFNTTGGQFRRGTKPSGDDVPCPGQFAPSRYYGMD